MHPLRLRLSAWFAGSALALLYSGAAPAQTTPSPEGPGLRFNGFGTVGLTHTDGPSGWGFRRDISQPPNDGGTRADIDSRLGLQLNYAPTPQLEFVGQVLLKRRVEMSPPIDSLEWAFASYRPSPDWTVRVGRTNPDAFLLSDHRSVGFAYLQMRPEVGFYGSLPVYSIDGIDVSRSWTSGDARWKARLFSGSGTTYGALNRDQPVGKVHMRNISGLTLSREDGGLTLHATATHIRLEVDNTGLDRLDASLAAVERLPLPGVAAEARALREGLTVDVGELTFVELGATYERAGWLFSGELSNIDGSLPSNHATAGYASVGRRFGTVTVYGVLAAVRSSIAVRRAPAWQATLTPVLGATAARQLQQLGDGAVAAINGNRQVQQSLSIGLRWDLSPRTALKLQWDHYRIGANGHQLWSNATPAAARANVGSLALDFIF